jgi:hypothetical protein
MLQTTKQPTPRPNSKTTDLRSQSASEANHYFVTSSRAKNLHKASSRANHLGEQHTTLPARCLSSRPTDPGDASASRADAAERKWLARHEISTSRRRGRQDWK